MLASALAVQLALAANVEGPVRDRVETLSRLAAVQASRPRGAAALIRLRKLMDEVDDLNLLAEPFGAVAFRASTHPRIRLLARLFLADVERARGRTTKARQLVADSGFVQDWLVVGGFEAEGGRGCEADLGPERSTQLPVRLPQRDGEVSWRPLAAYAPDGLVDLSHAVPSASRTVSYAVAFVSAEAEARVLLGLGATGAHRVFVNGVKVSSEDADAPARVDGHLVEVTLRRGVNRILVKLCGGRGQPGFYLRVDRSGASAPGLSVVPPSPTELPALERGAAPQPSRQETLLDLLWAEVRRSPGDASVRMDLATVLEHFRAPDGSTRTAATEARRAADASPAQPEVQELAATLQVDEPNVQRALLERALRADPRRPFSRLALAELELSRDFPDRALRAAEALLLDFPTFAPAHRLKARALHGLGEGAAAHKLAEASFRRWPWLPGVARDAVGRSRALQRNGEAVARARTVLALRHDDTGTRRLLATMLLESGEIDGAVDQLRRTIALEPFELDTHLRLGEVLASNGRREEARSAFATARLLAPHSSERAEREGRALLHWGEREGALASLQEALRLRPQNAALKDFIRTLRGEGAAPAWTGHPLDELEEAWGALPELARSQEDAVVLADVTAVRVHADGQTTRHGQLAVKVLSPRGAEQYRQQVIPWAPARQEVRVLRARVRKPDGRAIEGFSEEERSLSEPWAGMYYDSRAKVLTFPELDVGDVLDVQWRLEDTAAEALLGDGWGDLDYVRGAAPKLLYEYSVDTSERRTLRWNEASLPAGLVVDARRVGDRRVTTFRALNVPKVLVEPLQAGPAELYGPLHVSTLSGWEDVARTFWGLAGGQLLPGDELRARAARVLRGVDRRDVAKVVAALYGDVVTNTRYVALEFGIHGFKPYPVDRVLARGFGDCKDKAALLSALLSVAGVESRLVLLRTRSRGALPLEPASFAAFNHAILYVPALKLFLDGTAELHGSRELPSEDRAALALVVEPNGKGSILMTPESLPGENVSETSLDVALAADGSARIGGRIVTTGQLAPRLRRDFAAPAERRSVLEQRLGRSFPGVAVDEVSASPARAIEQPATLAYRARAPRVAELAEGGALRLFPLGAAPEHTATVAPLAQRTTALVLSGPWTERTKVRWTLPLGFESAEPRRELRLDSPFGRFQLSVAPESPALRGGRVGSILAESTLELASARIPVADYPRFRAWLQEVDHALGARMEVRRSPR